MTQGYADEWKKIERDREQRQELDRRSRDCERLLRELQCLLHQVGVVSDDWPETAVQGGAAGVPGAPAKA